MYVTLSVTVMSLSVMLMSCFTLLVEFKRQFFVAGYVLAAARRAALSSLDSAAILCS